MSVPAKRNQNLEPYLQKLLTPQDVEEDLAHPPVVVEESIEVLVFRLDQEKYGIAIDSVLEIIRYQEPASVPHTVEFLEGIISLRGEMIPVINGRKRLRHELKPPDKHTRIIILEEALNRYGLLVDSTTQVVRLLKNNIEPTPPVIAGIDADFIEGVCEHKGQLIILLNLRRFLEFN